MNTDIHNFCDGVAHVINLPERTDRITKFTSQFDALDIGWNLEVHAAINGNTVPHPDYWQSGDGAWGCYRSHLRIIEQAVSERRNGVLVFEDDAVFSDEKTLGKKWKAYLQACIKELPEDWGMFYLGGQHQRQSEQPVIQFSDHLHYAYSVNRTHGYAISRNALPVVYKHLLSLDWKPRHHIDHHLEVLHRSSLIPVFSSAKWLVSQDAGRSDIKPGNSEEPLRTWQVEAQTMQEKSIAPNVTTSFYSVGYGELGTDGKLGYEGGSVAVAETTSSWNWVSAHANSRLTIKNEKPITLIGAVDDTGRPRCPTEFRVDGKTVGSLTNAGEVTDELTLTTGTHMLEIRSLDNRQGHTVWGIRQDG